MTGRKGDSCVMVEEFFNAITTGDSVRVKEMLEVDKNLARAQDQNGLSAILKAVYFQKSEIAALLLETGMSLSIFEAAATGQTAQVKTLVSQDATLVNAFSADGFMPLGLAAFFGHRETVEALLAAGAPVNVASRESMKVTPLHSAAAAREPAIARLLIEHGANVNATQIDSGFTPLHEAAANGDLEMASLLIDRGADVNAEMKDGKTPLAFALERNKTVMAEFLRKCGAK